MPSRRENLELLRKFAMKGANLEDVENQSTLCKLVVKDVAEEENLTPDEKIELWKSCMSEPRTAEEILSARYPDIAKKRKTSI